MKSKRRKQWSEQSMLAAIKAVQEGLPIYTSAREHGVPRTTLQDRILGKVKHGAKPGPQPYMTSEQERETVEFLLLASKAGYPKTRADISWIAEGVARDKGILKGEHISHGWIDNFMKRHPELALRKGDATADIRMNNVTPETMKSYYDLLEEILEKHNLKNSPGQIYNVDETGMSLDQQPPKVVVKKGQKKVRYRTSGTKSQITVIGCVSAAGQALPPFVIFDGKSLNSDWLKGEVPGSGYGLSPKGWVDTEVFHGWFTKHFLKYAVSVRPLLLLLDGHSSHFQLPLIKLARDENVVIFCLPPHTTHASQPLDVSVYSPLKSHWRAACHQYIQKHPGRVVTKYQFCTLLNEAWMQTMKPSNICAGFKRCGIYPFNCNCQEKDKNNKGNILLLLHLQMYHLSILCIM